MGATQRYKQTQQQARVITNENGYLKGMYYTDVPLPEGYVKTLVNLDIDSLSGKLTPRPGLQDVQDIARDTDRPDVNHDVSGHNPLLVGEVVLPGSAGKGYAYCNLNLAKRCSNTYENLIQCAVYHSHHDDAASQYTGTYIICAPDNAQTDSKYYTTYLGQPLYNGAERKYGIHDQECVHTEFFRSSPGAFLNDQYFQFAKRFTQTPRLHYTKLGKEIVDDIVVNEGIYKPELRKPNQYYVCTLEPAQISPSMAVTQGYNMLADDPYTFKCERNLMNTVSILGVIPYNSEGQIVLNPQQNETLTLKAYFLAPEKYESTEFQARYYATAYQQITKEATDPDTGLTTTQKVDPKTTQDIYAWLEKEAKTIEDCAIGSYWRVTEQVLDTNGAYTDAYAVVTLAYNDTQSPYEMHKSFSLWSRKPNYSEKLIPMSQSGGSIHDETTVTVQWEWSLSTAGTWEVIHTDHIKFSEQGLEPFTCECTIPEQGAIIRVRVLDTTPIGEEDTDIVLATQTIGISITDSKGAAPKKYDLSSCTGMCEWEQRLVLWGVTDAKNILFVSDINNPGYFPYPNNVDMFSDPIMAAYNYGDELLVLTTNALYRLTRGADGTGWTHTLVQRNLHITEADLAMNCIIKNMFLFKSDNYYYMMVPKSSSGVKGDTSIAPISKQIEGLLDNFHEEVYKLVRLLTNNYALEDFTKKLCHYYSYVDGTSVMLNYVYDMHYDLKVKPGVLQHDAINSAYLYVQLIYATDSRTWRMRIFSAPYTLCVPIADSIQQTCLLTVLPILNDDGYAVNAKLVYCTWQNNCDDLPQYKLLNETDTAPHKHVVKNYQYIDTGNREIDTEHKKRFREFQFKIKNIDATELAFHTGFYVDGSERKNIIKYETSVDPTNNTIIVQPVLNDAITYAADGIFMPTVLGEEDSNVCWVVGASAFPGRTLWKVRMPVSGKGYTPRAELISRTEQKYELLGHSWVYRTMNGR